MSRRSLLLKCGWVREQRASRVPRRPLVFFLLQTCTLRCRVPPFIINPLPNEPHHDRARPSLPRRDPTLENAICTEKIIPAVPFVVLTRSNHLKLNSFSYYESGADPSPDIPGQPTKNRSPQCKRMS